ncbi:MAG TPA: hypothetical protein VHF51_19935 [Solirubrobacteraceae bacterium]|jgi:hypothetical protein|nr:hypothetical protein [Solirubrobacteraceae bacterium]
MSEPTCGQGLAEHSVLPGKLSEVMEAMAETLEVHRTALDLADERTRPEDAAYRDLAERQRAAAAQLRAIADEMAGHIDLPMGRHRFEVLTSSEAVTAFERFVSAERDLLGLVRQAVARHEAMLGAMRAA